LPAFKEYLTHGYFPFYKETGDRYATQLLQTIDIVLEVDLPATQHIDYYSIGRIRKLFSLIAQQVPVIPNISMLSKEVNVTRNSLLNYFAYLQKAQILLMLEKDATGFKQLAKPEKIYLGNTNYAYALGRESTNIGNIRETFFFNQMQVRHTVTYSQHTDFLIDDTYSFEVGGKAKTSKQISSLPNSYRVLDDIEYGHGNALPLWIFGFTY
jgi:predicted AAA+ superfamily ATPase